MPYITNLLRFLALFTVVFSTSACHVLALGGFAAGTVYVAQERKLGDAISDSSIWWAIKEKYLSHNARALLAGINVKVIEKTVHLTGTVNENESRIDAVRLAWQVEGVKEVVNEIIVKDADESTLKEIAHDKWIASQIKTKILLAKNVKSLNYSFEVVRQQVYIMGIAHDSRELNEVTRIASTVKGVQKVISYVKLKDDAARG